MDTIWNICSGLFLNAELKLLTLDMLSDIIAPHDKSGQTNIVALFALGQVTENRLFKGTYLYSLCIFIARKNFYDQRFFYLMSSDIGKFCIF